MVNGVVIYATKVRKMDIGEIITCPRNRVTMPIVIEKRKVIETHAVD